MLRRLCRKDAIAENIIRFFPQHTTYIEPFFGAGGIFFNKTLAKYNILNDLDSEVFNLFMILKDEKLCEEFKRLFEIMPISQDLWDFWHKEIPENRIEKAVRFVFFSNFGFMGKTGTMKFDAQNPKIQFEKSIPKINAMLRDAKINNCDFRRFFKSIDKDVFKDAFIYSDPPYFGTTDNYNTDGFTISDTADLLDTMIATKSKFAMSEFYSEELAELVLQRKLSIHTIGTRHNLGKPKTEILIVNYLPNYKLF